MLSISGHGRVFVLTGAGFARTIPESLKGLLDNLLALSNVAMLVFCIGALMWFLYWVFLRRILRARRIANARMKRLMREGRDQP